MPLKIVPAGQIQAERAKRKRRIADQFDKRTPSELLSLVPSSEPVTQRLDAKSQAELAAAIKAKRGVFAG